MWVTPAELSPGRYRLAPAFLSDFGNALSAFNASSATADSGHIGAHADFVAVANEAMEVVRRIDGLNTVRFKDQLKLLAKWEAAKKVFWSKRGKIAESTDGTSATPGGARLPTPGVTEAAA